MCEDSAALDQPPVNSWHVESSSADVIQEFISVPCSSYLSPESYYPPSWARGDSKKNEKKMQSPSHKVSFKTHSVSFCSKEQRCVTVMFYNFTNKLWLICCRSRHSTTKSTHMFRRCDISFCILYISALRPHNVEPLYLELHSKPA